MDFMLSFSTGSISPPNLKTIFICMPLVIFLAGLLIPTSGFYSPPRNAGRKLWANARFAHEPLRTLVSRESNCHSGPASRSLPRGGKFKAPLACGGVVHYFAILDGTSRILFSKKPGAQRIKLNPQNLKNYRHNVKEIVQESHQILLIEVADFKTYSYAKGLPQRENKIR